MSGGAVSSGVAAVVAAVEALDVDELTTAEDLTAVLEARAGLEAKALAAFGRHHAEGRCDVDGFRSPVGWLRAHVHLTDGEAKALAHRARTVQAWPTMQRLWVEGRLTGAQVATVVAMVPRAFRDLFAEHDAELSPVLVGCTLDQTREALVDWVARAEALLSPDPSAVVDPDEAPVAGFLRISRYGPDDQGAVAGDLDGDTTTIVEHALRVAERPDREGEDRLVSQRRAEALGRVCAFYLAHRGCDGGAGVGAGIVAVFDLPALYRAALRGLGVHDAAGLERLVGSHDVSLVEEGFLRDALAHSSGRGRTLEGLSLSPDAVTTIFGKGSTIERVLTAEGRVLDHGRKVRLFKGALRDLLLVRDRGCRFPTPTGVRCDAPVGWVRGHHVTEWDHGGVTSEANGAGACASHHGVIHRDGWSFEVHAEGSMAVTRPDGTTSTSPPPWAARPPTLPLHHPELDRLLRPRARPRPEAPPGADDTTGLEPAGPAEPAGPDVDHLQQGEEGDGIDLTRSGVDGGRPGDASRAGRSRVAPQGEDEGERAGATVPERHADATQPTEPTGAQAARAAALEVLERHGGAGRRDFVARLPDGTTLAIDLAA